MRTSSSLLSSVAVAMCLLFGSSAMAQTVSDGDYSASKTRINADYKADTKSCNAQASNAKSSCIAQAKNKQMRALAELDNSYKPTPKTQHGVNVANAQADYDTAKQKCADQTGDAKAACVKEAESALTMAKAKAYVQMNAPDTQAAGDDKAAQTTVKAASKTNQGGADAAADKPAAQMKAADKSVTQ